MTEAPIYSGRHRPARPQRKASALIKPMALSAVAVTGTAIAVDVVTAGTSSGTVGAINSIKDRGVVNTFTAGALGGEETLAASRSLTRSDVKGARDAAAATGANLTVGAGTGTLPVAIPDVFTAVHLNDSYAATRGLGPEALMWTAPSDADLSSKYGMRWGRLHAGLDFAAPYGAPVRSAAPGEVIFSGWQSGYGMKVEVKHDDGTITYYGHMSARSVVEGQRVAAGQQLGKVGNTGHSFGPHLHFEVHPNGGEAVDPLPWLKARGIKLT